jgi:hypothetical protein
MSPSDRVAQLYPQASGSLFVAFYYSQGYGGGILTRLQKGYMLIYVMFLLGLIELSSLIGIVMAGVRFPAGTRYFSLLHGVQTGSGAHPVSYPMGTRGSISGSKAAGA